MFRPIANLVMFNEDPNEFPSCKLTLHFPTNAVIRENDITVTENTSMFSSAKAKLNSDNFVTFTFNLGNWDDYRTFFGRFETEKNQSGHLIQINVPYTIETGANTADFGTVTADGSCALFYQGGKIFKFKRQIVDIKTLPMTWVIR